MTIKEFYDWAAKKGIEDYTIIIDVLALRSSYYGTYFAELENIYVDNDMASVTI